MATQQKGILDIFQVASLPSTHPGAVVERGGKAIRKNTQQGFLCYGQYKQGYPTIPLQAFFSILIDDNTSDDRVILILDVCDHQSDRVIGKELITRKDFPKANEFCLFKFDFTPPSNAANMEFRIYYMGYAYVLADKIAVINPAEISIKNMDDFQKLVGGTQPQPQPQPQPQDGICKGGELLCIPSFTPEIIQQKGSKDYGGTYRDGMYMPSNQGGIEFLVTIDTSRRYSMEFEIDGGLANWQRGENDGGRIVVIGAVSTDEKYWFMLQRMNAEEFGGGKFRGYLAIPDWHYASNLIPNYSMQNWGTEPHRIKIVLDKNFYTYSIDDFQAQMGGGSSVQVPQGVKQMKILLGNDIDRLPNFQAVTRFKWFKIEYV